MTTIVVDTVTLEFLNYWPSSTVSPPSVIGPNPQVSFETSEDPSVLMAVRDSDGNVTLVEDPQKVEAKTQRLWSQLRAERNRRLAACDFTALSDCPMSQERKDAWAQYRQALRDLPDEVTDPTNVTFPNDPSVPVPVQSTGSRLDNLLGQV